MAIGGAEDGEDPATKEFMAASRMLVAQTRQKRVIALHADVAIDLGLIQAASSAPVKRRDAAVDAGATPEQALAESVRRHSRCVVPERRTTPR